MEKYFETGKDKKMGILVGGGPAPGINSVISSVVIEAVDKGFQVIGFLEGYKHLAQGGMDPHLQLNISDISRITTTGGSFLKTSRVNPAKSVEFLENVVRVFRVLGITHLVSIGGEDTAFSTMKVAEHAEDQGYPLKTVHVPKTIDNDLPLPPGIPTFGFETARSYGTQLVSILAEDARSTGRWFVVVCMGRKAGHLALGIGKSAAATITLIPEEFDMKCSLKQVVDIIVGAIFKRLSMGRNYGIALVAEGFLELKDFFEGIDEVPRDDHGHAILAEIDFSGLLKREILERLAEFGTYLLEKGDILDWTKFLEDLKTHESPAKARIWEFLTDESKEQINNWTSDRPFNERSRTIVLNALNRIITKRDFFEREVFEDMDFSEELDMLIMKGLENLSQNQVQRFNRLLLKDIFPKEVAKISKMRIIDKDIGYELRCAPPVAFDVEYTRNLGYAAVNFLVNGGTQAMVSIQRDRMVPIAFKKMFDPKTGKVRVRTVEKESVFYKIAKEYMIRLEPEDFLDPAKLNELAKTAGVTPARFKEEFFHVVEQEARERGLIMS